MSHRPNSAPHYIVAKETRIEGKQAFQDLSSYVTAVTFTTDIGNFPSTQLDLVPVPGVGMADGKLYLPLAGTDEIFFVTRNDRILVVEVDEESYNVFRGGKDKARKIENGILVMWGVVADMMSGRAANRNVISVILESELAYLDTTLTQEMLGSRGAGTTCGSILARDAEYSSTVTVPTQEESGTVESIITQKFIGRFKQGDALNLDQTSGTYKKLGRGLKPFIVDEELNMIVEEVKGKDGSVNRLKVYPWPLVRLVTAHCIAQTIPRTAEAATKYGVDIGDVREKANKIIKLMCLIEAQAGENQNTYITLSRNEYASFVRTMIIQPLVTAPANAPSFWQLINSVLNQLHFYFTPKVLYRSESAGEKNLGSFQMMNPYRDYTAVFREGDLEAVENKVPGYKSIIKSVGFKARAEIPTFITNAAPELTQTMYQVYYPQGVKDYVLYDTNPRVAGEIEDLGKIPDYAYHKEIAFPKWLPDAIKSVEDLYQETISTEKQKTEEARSAMAPATGGVDADLKRVGATLRAFTKSALMIYGRINVTSTVSFVHLWPDCLNPLKVMLLDLGDHQQTTGLVSRVTVKWVQGKSYNITVNLSHVTDLRDSYYRALIGDLGVTKSDNLVRHYTMLEISNLDSAARAAKREKETAFAEMLYTVVNPSAKYTTDLLTSNALKL